MQAAGNSTKAAAANHVHFSSGMFLCAPSIYAPGTQTSVSVNTTTLTALSSGNPGFSTGSFTAPASGNVFVSTSFVSQCSGAFNTAIALATGGTTTVIAPLQQWRDGNGVATPHFLRFYVASLTPGNSYNFDFLAAVGSTGTWQITAISETSAGTVVGATNGGPVITTVQAV